MEEGAKVDEADGECKEGKKGRTEQLQKERGRLGGGEEVEVNTGTQICVSQGYVHMYIVYIFICTYINICISSLYIYKQL